MTRSEKAIDLLKRFLKLTEPGGCYGLPTPLTAGEEDQKDAQLREDFVNEVIGILTSGEPGEVPIEHRLESLTLSCREALTLLHEGTVKAIGTGIGEKLTGGSMVETATILADYQSVIGKVLVMGLHIAGVDQAEIERPISEKDVERSKALDCACAKCRKERAKK